MSCTPTFIGIGAQKAGTSWLYYWLNQHPRACFPGGKETHYWSSTPDPDGGSWLSMFRARSDKPVQGEITPAYAMLATEVVKTIHHLCPEARIFFSLRNPIERAWAQVRMVFDRHGVPLTDLAQVFEFIDSPRCVGRNDYIGTVERWTDVWGEGALHLLLFDDLVERPREVLTRLSLHIGLDPAPFRQIATDTLRQKVFAGAEIDMPPAVRDHLRQRYRRDIVRVGEMLRRDLSGWLR